MGALTAPGCLSTRPRGQPRSASQDQIAGAGYQVWLPDAEDVLYEHEAVREAAIIGGSDECRGESVRALVQGVPATNKCHTVPPANDLCDN